MGLQLTNNVKDNILIPFSEVKCPDRLAMGYTTLSIALKRSNTLQDNYTLTRFNLRLNQLISGHIQLDDILHGYNTHCIL